MLGARIIRCEVPGVSAPFVVTMKLGSEGIHCPWGLCTFKPLAISMYEFVTDFVTPREFVLMVTVPHTVSSFPRANTCQSERMACVRTGGSWTLGDNAGVTTAEQRGEVDKRKRRQSRSKKWFINVRVGAG